MKVSDYIVNFLEEKGVTDMFGYPGVGCGHLMDSLKNSKIASHLVYHEQAAAFAACSYAQACKKVGFAYSTSGPGGTNLITGISNAYCDSIPTIFIVGDKDLAAQKRDSKMRQRTSQEIDITAITAPITKWSYQIQRPNEVRYVFEKAFHEAINGRPGPVLIDFPSDIQRAEIEPVDLKGYEVPVSPDYAREADLVVNYLKHAKTPLILVGNGIKQAALDSSILLLSKTLNIPLVTTLMGIDMFTGEENKLGYIGLDGDAIANLAVNNCDVLLSLGARLNFKQVCNNRQTFATKAKVLRVDIDKHELEYGLRDEERICADVNYFVPALVEAMKDMKPYDISWKNELIKKKKKQRQNSSLNVIADAIVEAISMKVPAGTPVVTDTGSHRRWVMSHFRFKEEQRLYQSSGLGSMGYSLPASIGLYHATKKPVVCFDGDGGIMMNLQELQYITREQIPVTIVVFNNHCLGDIMEFQKKIFKGNYFTTTEDTGYQAADFEGIAKAFHLQYTRVEDVAMIEKMNFTSNKPQFIEVIVPSNIA